MTEIDEIEQAAALAEAATGARGGGAKIPLCLAHDEKQRSLKWTAEEEAFVRENHGRITEDKIAAQLGRSPISVHLRIKRELRLVAPSKAPEILTAEQTAWGLGLGCGKSIHRLMDDGLMPGRRLPGMDVTRVIDRQALLLWMLEPMHWIYFRPDRVGSLRCQGNRVIADCYDFEFWELARDLILAASAAWKDEWLTPGQVARELELKWGSRPVNAAILRGALKATRWGNWWILRSDLPAKGMRINAQGRIVPKIKPRYVCPRGMKHFHLSTCMKLRVCREMIKPRTA